MITPEEMAAYAAAHSTPPPAEIAGLIEETRGLAAGQMGSGPIVARLLETLVRVIRPRLVVEIGTFTGIATLAMAAGLSEDGRVLTCEVDSDRAATARERFAKSPLGERIELVERPALELVASIDEPVDLAWVDGDKTENAALCDALLERLSEHGLIAVDNTLRNGTVLAPEDDVARAVDRFNTEIAADPRAVATLLPFSDGVTLIRRA